MCLPCHARLDNIYYYRNFTRDYIITMPNNLVELILEEQAREKEMLENTGKAISAPTP